jgi:hypothetical protein
MFYYIFLIDCIQLALLSFGFYHILEWLSADQTKNLKGYFLGLCGTSAAAWYFQLSGIMLFLWMFWPAFFIFFFLIHEKQLQKNFITTAPRQPIKQKNIAAHTWIDTIIQIGLYNMVHHKNNFNLIEMNQPLSSLISSVIPLNVPIEKKLLEILSDTTLPNHTSTILYSNKGNVCGFDLLMKLNNIPFIDTSIDQQELFESIHIFTQATDALALWAHYETHTWTLYSGSSIFEHLNAKQIRHMLLKSMNIEPYKGGEYAQPQNSHVTQIQS